MNRRYAWVIEACVYGFALAVVVAMGMANLYLPFGRDQALYFYGAKVIDQGADYYVDFWDNKPPGLYYFYLLAGRSFGFSEFGVHMFELLWMLVFAVILMLTLRSAFQRPWMSAFVPVTTIAVYYAMAGEHELTQLEFIVSLPLFCLVLCLLAAHRHRKAMPHLYFISGLLAGVAVVFKLMLAPLCVGLWLIALAYQFRSCGVALTFLVVRGVLPAGLGVALVLGCVVLPFALRGHLDELIWTSFIYPPEALEYAPAASKSRLVTASAFFMSGIAPWALFAAAATVFWVRGERDLLSALMLVWFVIGIGLFIVQRFSWWQHHTFVMLFPAGLLAVIGIDRLVSWIGDEASMKASLRAVIAGLLALTATVGLSESLIAKAQPLLSTTVMLGRGVWGYQSLVRVSEHYGRLRRGVQFLLGADALPGPIYVFGNAMAYEFSGRAAAHPTVGSSWKFYLPGQIDDILQTLDREQTPYVLVDRTEVILFRLRPQIAAYLDDCYVLLHTDDSGMWFRRRGLAEEQLGIAPDGIQAGWRVINNGP